MMINYRLEGPIAPKARPKFGNGRSYLPNKYRTWREEAELQLMAQEKPPQPLEGVNCLIALHGKHNRRSDLDNVAGAILDALVAVGILRDDNLKCVCSLSIELHHSKENPIALIMLDRCPNT